MTILTHDFKDLLLVLLRRTTCKKDLFSVAVSVKLLFGGLSLTDSYEIIGATKQSCYKH